MDTNFLTERLIIRDFTPEDAPFLQECLGDKDVARQTMTKPHPFPESLAVESIEKYHKFKKDGVGIILALTLKDTNQFIGLIGLMFNTFSAALSKKTFFGSLFFSPTVLQISHKTFLIFSPLQKSRFSLNFRVTLTSKIVSTVVRTIYEIPPLSKNYQNLWHIPYLKRIKKYPIYGVYCSEKVKPEHKKGDIGYLLSKPFWGKGYATEASKKMLEVGFKEFGLEKVAASAFADNPASMKVLEKIGLRHEGTSRKDVIKWEEARDVAFYGILKEEYEEKVRRDESNKEVKKE